MVVSWITDFLRPLLPHIERFRTRSITVDWLLYTPYALPSNKFITKCIARYVEFEIFVIQPLFTNILKRVISYGITEILLQFQNIT
jgi:hypothetical protein